MPPATLVLVVPTKNRRGLLERALDSVLSQDYDNYRIIVVDDGSTDDTQHYLRSVNDPRIQIIHHEKSRGVNAARNAALRALKEGEWAVQLDDDDTLLPHALRIIGDAIAAVPDSIQVLCFNTVMRTASGDVPGGRDFAQGQSIYEPTYIEIMTHGGPRELGDGRPVWKWTLFPEYLFQEDINGYEGEWWLLVARDDIGIRFLPQQTTLIDIAHPGEHLSAIAAKQDRISFARAHARIFKAHKVFYATHPRRAMRDAFGSLKNAVRAYDVPHAALFSWLILRAAVRSLFTSSS